MKCLVTGGAGFIGSHLAQALCERGARVVVLDNLSAGSLDNLQWTTDRHQLEFIQGDVNDDSLLRQCVSGCDWVFHEAAIASVPRSIAAPLESNRDNLEAALRLMVIARDAGVKRFLFASSSAIYGDGGAQPKRESMEPDPISPYALQKYAAEKYAQLFHRLYGLETVSLRYFNVFGPRQSVDSPYSGVIARFCTAMLRRQPPTVFGDGLQSRDFVYIDNVVQANLQAAEASADQVAGRFFNIAGGASVTLLDLIQAVNLFTQQSLPAQFLPARPGDVRYSAADISAARQAFGYAPQVNWQDGLRETLRFYAPSPSVP